MRRIALCATLALIGTCAVTTAALGDGGSTVVIDSHITPVIRQFTTKTTPATLTVNLKFQGPNGQAADTLQSVLLKFSYGAHINGNLFPSCSADMIRNHTPCPKGSQIGSGSALGILGDVREPIDVKMYNGIKGKSITFLISGQKPAVINVPFDAPLQTYSGGTYNYGLTVNVPDILQEVVGIPVQLDFFNVKVGATRVVKGRKRGWVETLICPPKALVPLSADFGFRNAPSYHTDDYIHCGA